MLNIAPQEFRARLRLPCGNNPADSSFPAAAPGMYWFRRGETGMKEHAVLSPVAHVNSTGKALTANDYSYRLAA